MSNCTVELGRINKLADEAIMTWKMDAESAVQSIIGTPNKRHSNYKIHQELYDGLYDYFVESGNIALWDLDPWVMSAQWKDYFATKYIDYWGNDLSREHKTRIKSMLGRFKSVKKTRAKVVERMNKGKDGMTNTQRALMPPDILAMSVDRYGFISKIVKVTRDLGDKIKQSWNIYDSEVSDLVKDYTNGMSNIYQTVDDTKILDGLHNLVTPDKDRGLGMFNDRDLIGGRVYSILEVSKDENGERIYRVTFNDKPGMPAQWVKRGTIGITAEQYQEAFISKYSDDLINDLLHGQTRQVKWLNRRAAKNIYTNGQNDNFTIEQELERRAARGKHADVDDKDHRLVTQYVTIPNPNPDSSMPLWTGQVQYVQIKSPEGKGQPEEYVNYIISVSPGDSGVFYNENDKDGKYAEVFGLMQKRNGFYNSQKQWHHRVNQEVLTEKEAKKLGLWDKNKKVIDSKKYQKWADKENDKGTYLTETNIQRYEEFQYMENQPDLKMIETRQSIGLNKTGVNIWDVINQFRATYKNVREDMTKKNKESLDRERRLRRQLEVELKRKGLDEDERQQWFTDNILAAGGLDSKVWISPTTGEIYTPDTFFRGKEQNYAPIMWSSGEFSDMVITAYNDITAQIRIMESEGQDVEDLQKQADDFRKLIELQANSNPSQSMVDAASTVHQEQRGTWTDQMRRRKSLKVHTDYLDKTYRNLHKNDVVLDLMEQMYNVIKTDKQMPKSSIEYMLNRVKTSFGHSNTINKTLTPLGWADLNNEKLSDWFNSLPEGVRGGREWNAADAEKLWLSVNGVVTMKFLGAGGAVGNRSQIINQIVKWGVSSWWETQKRYKQDPAFWDGVIANTGIDNMLSVLNDIMLQGGEVDWKDAGLVPFSEIFMELGFGANIGIPTARFIDWRKVRRAGRMGFINNPDKRIDNVLLKLMTKNMPLDEQGNIQEAIHIETMLNDFQKTGKMDTSKLSKMELAILKEKRGAYWEFMENDKDGQNRELVTKQLQTILGKVDDNLLRKMVTFKLSFWLPNKSFGKELFTFTEGERAMRQDVAMQALIVADKKKLLGSGTQEERFKSPAAVKMARDAVYQMMFGMSPTFLGEGFAGISRMFSQYKSYPLFQTIHDWDTAQNFIKGGNTFENMGRILQAASLLTPGLPGTYTVDNKDIDQDAAAFLRLVMIRGLATTVAVTSHLIPFASMALSKAKFGFSDVRTTLRAGESPMLGMALRTTLWWSMAMMGWGDREDREKSEEIAMDNWMRFLTPVIISYIARSIYDMGKGYSEDVGVWDWDIFD